MPPLDSCVDIDECSLGKCGANTDCINNDGDYECVCQKDYMWDSGSSQPATKERLMKKIRGHSFGLVFSLHFLSYKRTKTVEKQLA